MARRPAILGYSRANSPAISRRCRSSVLYRLSKRSSMRSGSQGAESTLDVQESLDVQMLGQRAGPKVTFDVQGDEVSLDPGPDLKSAVDDPRLENIQRLGQLAFELAHREHHNAEKMACAKVDHRTKRIRIVLKAERTLAFLGKMRAGPEEPLQIAQHTLAIALNRNDPLCPALLRVVRLVVGQTVEEARLKFFDDTKLRHTIDPENRWAGS